jgi:hypothetical protein
MRDEFLERYSVGRHNARFTKFVTDNIYREENNIPTNMELRDPDWWMKKAMKDSYVSERTKLLQKYSIDPNLGNFGIHF